MTTASREPGELLRIGELSARTGVNTRLLRYYEAQGLLAAQRSATGQRLFEPNAVEQVRSIRMLLDAGLPTRVIGELLGCLHEPGRLEPCAVPMLAEHLRAYDERIADLTSTRTALQGLIDAAT
ncbi:MerR family transcriptional regulator [Saccharomonospora sp. CUA-673]|uniref:MerR family transcriptional regulator n=1 Tax=Saccharomonospora sp. CUA-673 TaxID=1904969 RepID=UPI000A95ED49|nr:MerR family transcriptional regulator [Saccharomonospora sp. CUA-673]